MKTRRVIGIAGPVTFTRAASHVGPNRDVMSQGRSRISVERTRDGVRIRAPLSNDGPRRSPLTLVGGIVAIGISVSAFLRHDVRAGVVFAGVAAFGMCLLALVYWGRSVATLETETFSFRQAGLLNRKHRGRAKALAFGSVTLPGRYGSGAVYPVAIRFEDGSSAIAVVDAGSILEAERIAREAAGACGLRVEPKLPRQPTRKAARPTIALTSIVLGPMLALLIYLFLSTHVSHDSHAAQPRGTPPARADRSALPAPTSQR